MCKKLFSLSLVAILAISMFVGCGQSAPASQSKPAEQSAASSEKASSTPASSEAAPQSDAKLNMIYWHPEQKDIMEQINQKFTEQNAGTSVTLELVPGDQYDKVLKTRLLSDNGPDVYMYFGSLAYTYAKEGHLADLTNEPFAKNVIDAYKDTCSYDGKLYAIPLNAQAYGVFYNKKVFEEAGIAATPKTYDEFLAACEKIKAIGKVPVARGAKDMWTSIHEVGPLTTAFVFAKNADFQAQRYEDKVKFANSPELKNFFGRYVELVDKGYIEKGVLGMNHSQAMQEIADGNAAMVLGLSVFYGEIKAANPDVELGYFALPNEDGKVAMSGSSDKAIGYWPKGKNIEASKKLVGFYASPEINKMYCEATQMLPCIKDVDVNLDEPMKMLAKDLADAPTIFNFMDGFWPAPAYESYRKSVQAIHSGETNIDQILADMDKVYDDNKNLIGAPVSK